MFTGIVRGTGQVVSRIEKDRLIILEIDTHGLTGRFFRSPKIGASVAIAGVCLSIIKKHGNIFTFDVMEETTDKTTLCNVQVGDRVNIEPSFRVGDDIGGHILSGHIIGQAEICKIETRGDVTVMTFTHDNNWLPYIFEKGFIALDGCSLTIVDANEKEATFCVHLIPETMRRTTFGLKKIGDKVNLEIDSRIQAIVDTQKRISNQNLK